MSSSRVLTSTARRTLFRRAASSTNSLYLCPTIQSLRPHSRSFASSTYHPSRPHPPVPIKYGPAPSASSHAPLPDSYFACNVFDRRTVKKYLTSNDYTQYMDTLTNNRPIDAATADSVASALLRWATERGATHFTHWFQPITAGTAEKHDSFVEVLRDGETPLLRFTGKQVHTPHTSRTHPPLHCPPPCRIDLSHPLPSVACS